jgi:M6 family metalloprotease-like protein
LWAATLPAWAIKANRKTVTMRQPDGTTFRARIYGDENVHYVTTLDGYMVAKGSDHYFHYVDFDATTHQRILSDLYVRNAAERTTADLATLSGFRPAVAVQQDLLSLHKLRPFKQPQQLLSRSVVAPGLPRLTTRAIAEGETATASESHYLVILVSFQDCAFTYTADDFERWLNEPGYSVNGGTGSVKDYYRDQSMGQFIPDFTVVGPYTLDHEQTYYAANDDSDSDCNPRAMISEAVRKARIANPQLKFAQFDNDGDGYVDNLYVIYAGYSEASTGDSDDMWPHSWTMGDDVFSVSGKYINNYSCSAELVGSPGVPEEPTMDGIGTFTHEFGHILGLKDMYDTDDYDSGYGLDPGDYSLYASGSYNNDSRTPPNLMAFERLQLGWAREDEDIVALNDPEDVALPVITTNKARYINAQPSRPDSTGYEWFVLENRQQTGWDTYIPGHGLLIYHYDYTQEMQDLYWTANGPNNNASHRCLYIVPADNVDDNNSRNGDTYPGRSGNTSFTDTSTPNSLNWDNQPTGVPVTNILERDSIIYFQVKGGVSTWNVLRTLKPTEIYDTAAVFSAAVEHHMTPLREVGFCWSAEGEPSIADAHIAAELSEAPTVTVTTLTSGTRYNVKAYMILDDEAGTVVYGSAVPFRTECPTVYAPFHTYFTSWTDGEPDCWEIVDNNADGSTWEYDDTYEAMVYDFNYWNDADDWIVSKRRFHIPAHGAIYFSRGVTDISCVEGLEVYVSTRTSNLEDFVLYKKFSFADYISMQAYEEVDLSEFAGRDIYVAFRCCSEKLQNSLWFWDVALVDKLTTPQITKFESTATDQLYVEWTPVDSALYYYLYFGKETDQDSLVTEFAPITCFEKVTGDVDLGVGSIFFKSSGVVELEAFPDSLMDLKFMVTTSGPIGTSTLRVEGSVDGEDWFQIGPKVSLSEYDSEGQECDWENYVADMGYKKLRFTFTHNGRNGRIKYLTLEYKAGKVVEDLAAGRLSSNSATIDATTPGEFDEGTFITWVAAGDGFFFYDESPWAYYSGVTSGLERVESGDAISVRQGEGRLTISGLRRGEQITCTSPAGVLLWSSVAQAETVTLPATGWRGALLLTVEGQNRQVRSKIMLK